MSCPDLLLFERLRKENLEQFLTLVRMHLSFVVDLSTDDVDGSTEKPKQFRWNFYKKTKCSSVPSQNITKNAADVNITEEGMSRVYELIDFLSKDDNVIQEGIFRRTGSLSRQQELRQLLLTGSNLGLDEGRFTVHDCASVLKGFLAELPQPLLMDQYYQTYCILASQYIPTSECSESKLLTALQLLLLLLTPLHRSFLQRLLTLLRKAADNEASNRMSPDTLATMFTPHLLCPRKLSPENFHADSVAMAPLISFMIRHSEQLFAAPQQLATDVAAYFTIRERKKMLSPDIDLDESITDRCAASTVYTFVDRGRSVRARAATTTDTALAQLYAHIQALPDSAHKRRLVKQFNRQNGYGTPIQVQRTGKAAGSRSLGDSIKRHIFHKGLLNKTPKKGSGNNLHTVEEKTNKEKLRLTQDSNKTDVSHKNVVLKNLANKMASAECLDDNEEYESDVSNESTLSEGALSNRSKKHSPKFVSEPNLSVLDGRNEDETPKITKKRGNRLFRSKMLSASQNLNKRYQKRGNAVRGTPTSCVSCFDDQDTMSDNDAACTETNGNDKHPLAETPKKSNSKSRIFDDSDEQNYELSSKINYLTSTPGISEAFDDQAVTPYTLNFRRASMSPITKSTQKLSKAMQESIMTPRSRKPLIITSEQRDCLPPTEQAEPTEPVANEPTDTSDLYLSMSHRNDSDFVSSDDDTRSRSRISEATTSRNEVTRFVISRDRAPTLNVTRCEINDSTKKETAGKSLSEPFRDYLLSRSVLTATPVDLSILNKSTDPDEKITESLMYCLDGNVPSDLTSSINNLAVDKYTESSSRSPLKNINNVVSNSLSISPNRKRCNTKHGDLVESEKKKALLEKENVVSDGNAFELRETEL